MNMNLYKKTAVESFGHECFFQKILICCDKARLVFVQNENGKEIIDSYVTNPDDFKLYETQAEYLAYIKLITKDGELPYQVALTTTLDLVKFEADIHNKFVDIRYILDGKLPERKAYDKDSEYEQLMYLMTFDKTMEDVDPCDAVKEVLELHEEYLKSDDIRLAYLYEEKIKNDFRAQITLQAGFIRCKEILKLEIKDLMKKLGYQVELDWLNDCSIEQLQRIFDFDWINDKPNYQQIKDVLIF